MDESKSRIRRLNIIIINLIIADLIVLFFFVLTVGAHDKHSYVGMCNEPVDDFKNIKEYDGYAAAESLLMIEPEKWVNYCGYDTKEELKNGILINSEEELKSFYNKVLKETATSEKTSYISSGDSDMIWDSELEFYKLLKDLIAKTEFKNFKNNSLIVYYYDNSTNVCGMKVTDVNIDGENVKIDVAVSEKNGAVGIDSNGDERTIDDNSELLVIKTDKIKDGSDLTFNFEKYDCYVIEKELE